MEYPVLKFWRLCQGFQNMIILSSGKITALQFVILHPELNSISRDV